MPKLPHDAEHSNISSHIRRLHWQDAIIFLIAIAALVVATFR